MAILNPRKLLGSVVWYNTRTEGKVTKIFNLLQNKASRLILGAFKSSPIKDLNHDADTRSFTDLAVQHHHNYVYKHLTAPPTHPLRKILQRELLRIPDRHQSPIHRLLHRTGLLLPNENILETIYPYPKPPWSAPRWEVENVGVNRDEVKEKIKTQVDDEISSGACVMFTDGSFIPEVGAGAAIALENQTARCA